MEKEKQTLQADLRLHLGLTTCLLCDFGQVNLTSLCLSLLISGYSLGPREG